uniref:Uncharacterized protein n=1 Tax=Anguilla anguilla TaxID=7936 RepID=A0A0E9V9X5_ANGAN
MFMSTMNINYFVLQQNQLPKNVNIRID